MGVERCRDGVEVVGTLSGRERELVVVDDDGGTWFGIGESGALRSELQAT